ncbi:hypothetical protein [Serinibacter salmoneus]|uniref:Methyltransferase family protein n=1 Tax=Serinibacter salmoneus TaxID=556530 RepID=A0A2A9D4A6_9MICO|nr:hypothetical protein [Serinibacter salmoneus]PFG21221.1 hypothetical protein ATL40_2844 [Serinibacter salmoneus]
MPSPVTWTQYRATIGDRTPLFAALAEAFEIHRALYLGSYVDLAPSTAIEDVTYVDLDRRAARFFADEDLVRAELVRGGSPAPAAPPVPAPRVRFLAADFTQGVDAPQASMDLLISLFTVPAWEACRRYLRPGGYLLANASHGEASLAALDPALTLVAAVEHRDGRYRLVREGLERYLVPKRPEHANAEHIRATGRGIAYTRPAFGYLFRSD